MTDPHNEAPMAEDSIISHLIELRARLLRAVFAVLVVVLALLPFANHLYRWLALPLLERMPEGTSMIAIDVISPFLAPLKLTAFVGLVVAMPFVLYQLWAFVAPGLYKHEKRLAKPLLVSATLLFYAGCAFAYFIVMPMAFRFLTAVGPEGVAMMTDINSYLNFVLMMFLAFGLAFEVPVAVVLLCALGVVNPNKLGEFRGYVVVAAFIIGAILTPPDIISQTMLAIPMWFLYEIGVLVAKSVVRGQQKPTEVTDS